MKRLNTRDVRISKRVSWASEYDLCKVRLFLSDDSPSVIGIPLQDQLQAKASWILHPNGGSLDDALPPGFEGGNPVPLSHVKASDVPSIKWTCPPRLTLVSTWQVVAGEESNEIRLQSEREMRVLEAVYPRFSVIPQDPTFASDMEDSNPPNNPILVPITPVEDEDVSDPPNLTKWPQVISQQLHTSRTVNSEMLPTQSLERDASFLATKNGCFSGKIEEQRAPVDHDLLAKLLNNRALIEKLVTDSVPGSNLHNMVSSIPQYGPSPTSSSQLYSSHFHMSRNGNISGTSLPPTSSGNGTFIGSSIPAFQPPPAYQVKDMNYYKSLIQQHGGEKQEKIQQLSNRDKQFGMNHDHVISKYSKPKYMKPCAFFNSSSGCRNGANCAYQHDSNIQHRSGTLSEAPNAKRLKIDRG